MQQRTSFVWTIFLESEYTLTGRLLKKKSGLDKFLVMEDYFYHILYDGFLHERELMVYGKKYV